ncbi:hypothetical protein PSEUDO8Z_120144 [Pseudomonas sp. 8Z]|nr:hypothetical protein PSEUDO8Z_120144 [Pseudomonas sp. 8Z]
MAARHGELRWPIVGLDLFFCAGLALNQSNWELYRQVLFMARQNTGRGASRNHCYMPV